MLLPCFFVIALLSKPAGFVVVKLSYTLMNCRAPAGLSKRKNKREKTFICIH
uniref:Uncharacterized protein n=1 Tax=Arundo donax TaxID=35708 RepID=A0A0A8YJ92_ARUDO